MRKLFYLTLFIIAGFLLYTVMDCQAADGEVHLKNGLKAYREEANFGKAISELQEAIRLGLNQQADLIQAHLYLGFAYIGDGQRMPAEAEFAEAIKLDPALDLDPKIHSTKIVTVFNETKERLVDSLTIVSVPGGAEVHLNGQSLGITPLKLNSVLIGEHALRVVKEYFQPKELKIQVEKGKDNRISAQLDKKEMEIPIASRPPGAAVYVSEKYEGRTPLSLKMVLDQELAVKLAKEEFLDKELSLRLTEAGVTISGTADVIPVKDGLAKVQIELDPAPLPGSLRVVSDPPGATVYLDGIDLGEAPLTTAKVTPGVRRLRVSMPGFASVTEKVEVISGQETVVEIALGGRLHILSVPGDAQVFIDEEYIGVTPLKTRRIPAGSRQLRLAKDEYKDRFNTVMVERGQEKEVNVRLLPVKGSIAVSSDPSDATVYLDGEIKGNTPLFVYGVMIGQYSLRLTKPGYEDWEKQIIVEELKISWQFTKLKR